MRKGDGGKVVEGKKEKEGENRRGSNCGPGKRKENERRNQVRSAKLWEGLEG